MPETTTISVPLPSELAAKVETIARRENRSLADLVLELVSDYERQHFWDETNAYGRARAAEVGLTEDDVVRVIREYRAEERQRQAVGS